MSISNGKTAAACVLCLSHTELCESHIIPEFFYELVYDEKHRFLKISTDSSKRIVSVPKGIYERLLCEGCERRIATWETYASKVCREMMDRILEDGNNFTINVEYADLKLFAMSLLWRSGVSKRMEFASVTLNKHEERLRRMLNAGDPGKPSDYGFAIVFPPDSKAREIFRGAILAPELFRNNGHHGYRFMLGVTSWLFIVSSHMQTVTSGIFSLHNDGTLQVRNGGSAIMDYLHQISVEISDSNTKRKQFMNNE